MNSGFIKLYRQLKDNPIVMKDGDHLAIWAYLLLNVTHKELNVVFKKEKIILKAGELITGRKKIAMDLKIAESKVERVLNLFEKEHQIEQQKSNKNRLISIVNWNIYQSSEQQMDNKWTANEQQVNTNKNNKNKRNNNILNSSYNSEFNINMSKSKNFIKPTLEEVKQYCLERKNSVDAENFINFYESKDWYVGKNKMKDWKASVRTWEKNSKKSFNPARDYDTSSTEGKTILNDYYKNIQGG